MAKLTAAQRKRLDKLATYLEGLPEDYAHFEMQDFLGIDDNSPIALEYAKRNGGVPACGTVACAAGHGPAAGILVPLRFRRGGRVNWSEYSELFVGEADEYRGHWDWCFGGMWSRVDNHHWGAAARIRFLLDHGSPPAEFERGELYRRMLPLYAPYRIDAAKRSLAMSPTLAQQRARQEVIWADEGED